MRFRARLSFVFAAFFATTALATFESELVAKLRTIPVLALFPPGILEISATYLTHPLVSVSQVGTTGNLLLVGSGSFIYATYVDDLKPAPLKNLEEAKRIWNHFSHVIPVRLGSGRDVIVQSAGGQAQQLRNGAHLLTLGTTADSKKLDVVEACSLDILSIWRTTAGELFYQETKDGAAALPVMVNGRPMTGVSALACYYTPSMIVAVAGGTAYWGIMPEAVPGLGFPELRPMDYEGPRPSAVMSAAIGAGSVVVLGSNGHAYQNFTNGLAWSRNFGGRRLRQVQTMQKEPLTNVVQIGAGFFSSFLTADGKLYGSGRVLDNASVELTAMKLPTLEEENMAVPIPLEHSAKTERIFAFNDKLIAYESGRCHIMYTGHGSMGAHKGIKASVKIDLSALEPLASPIARDSSSSSSSSSSH